MQRLLCVLMLSLNYASIDQFTQSQTSMTTFNLYMMSGGCELNVTVPINSTNREREKIFRQAIADDQGFSLLNTKICFSEPDQYGNMNYILNKDSSLTKWIDLGDETNFIYELHIVDRSNVYYVTVPVRDSTLNLAFRFTIHPEKHESAKDVFKRIKESKNLLGLSLISEPKVKFASIEIEHGRRRVITFYTENINDIQALWELCNRTKTGEPSLTTDEIRHKISDPADINARLCSNPSEHGEWGIGE